MALESIAGCPAPGRRCRRPKRRACRLEELNFAWSALRLRSQSRPTQKTMTCRPRPLYPEDEGDLVRAVGKTVALDVDRAVAGVGEFHPIRNARSIRNALRLEDTPVTRRFVLAAGNGLPLRSPCRRRWRPGVCAIFGAKRTISTTNTLSAISSGRVPRWGLTRLTALAFALADWCFSSGWNA